MSSPKKSKSRSRSPRRQTDTLSASIRKSKSPARKVPIKIGSRNSPLAMWQSRHVKALLEEKYPNQNFLIVDEATYGDKNLDRSLVEIGQNNPGLFTKELEVGLLQKATRLVVHSLKDMPTTLPNGLILTAITERSTAYDCVVMNSKFNHIKNLKDLPKDSIIGTSSLRREALLKKYYPHLKTQNIRGNVQTRLKKLDADDSPFACILMAKVGLERVNLDHRINIVLESWPYCVGQGALGIETRDDDEEIQKMCLSIEHTATAYRCLAERSLLNALEGGCQIAMGVRSALTGNKLSLYAIVLSTDGQNSFESKIEETCDSKDDAVSIGRKLADQLREGGAEKIVGKPTNQKRPLTYGSADNPQRPGISGCC